MSRPTKCAKRGERREAQKISSDLLRSVGIHLGWRVCRGGRVNGPDDDDCSDPPGARELVMRLASGSAPPPAVLGFAYAPGIVATALVDRIQAAAQRVLRPMARVLGAVMAHELVHLLVGSGGHAAQGVMRGEWTEQDIRLGRIWKISLTADERRAIAAGIRRGWDAADVNAALRTPRPN